VVFFLNFFKRCLVRLRNIFAGNVGTYKFPLNSGKARDNPAHEKVCRKCRHHWHNSRVATSPKGQAPTSGQLSAPLNPSPTARQLRIRTSQRIPGADNDMTQKNCCMILAAAVILLGFILVPPLPAGAATPSCGELVEHKCLTCHYETRICQKLRKKKGKGSWKKTIKSMIRKGAVVSKAEQKSLIICFSKRDRAVLELCGLKK